MIPKAAHDCPASAEVAPCGFALETHARVVNARFEEADHAVVRAGFSSQNASSLTTFYSTATTAGVWRCPRTRHVGQLTACIKDEGI
ncbi:MAG: hypothetical protein WAV54_11495 [Acidimicrobiales bacterium]